jgi:hypothetical protein
MSLAEKILILKMYIVSQSAIMCWRFLWYPSTQQPSTYYCWKPGWHTCLQGASSNSTPSVMMPQTFPLSSLCEQRMCFVMSSVLMHYDLLFCFWNVTLILIKESDNFPCCCCSRSVFKRDMPPNSMQLSWLVPVLQVQQITTLWAIKLWVQEGFVYTSILSIFN